MQPKPRLRSATAIAVEAAVQQCLSSGEWRSYSGSFLRQLADWYQSELNKSHVRLCSSGTFGVELALRSLHLKSTDEVILSGYDFPGNFRAVDDAGARVVLCDPGEEDGWTLTVKQLEQCVAPETKAVVISHLHGELAPMPAIMEWAQSRGILVVEDACQAHGATLSGQAAGSYGDLVVFSFGGSKLLSAGRGGLVATNHDLFAQRMRHYCERGNDAFPMSEIQAAAVLPQCQRLREDHRIREQNAMILIEALNGLEWLKTCNRSPGDSSSYYKIGLRVNDEYRQQHDVDSIAEHWRNLGVSVGAGFMGFANRSPKRFRSPHSLQTSRRLAESTLVIHHSHLLDPFTGESTVPDVIRSLEKLEQEFTE